MSETSGLKNMISAEFNMILFACQLVIGTIESYIYCVIEKRQENSIRRDKILPVCSDYRYSMFLHQYYVKKEIRVIFGQDICRMIY